MSKSQDQTRTDGPENGGADGASFRFLLTAQEAYVAFEEAVLDSTEDIRAGFRVFDFSTRLHSERAREIGQDWFDLIEHALRRGVRLDLTITDFDPVARPELHRMTWRTVKMAHAVADMADAHDRLHVRAAMHPAQVGALPRLAFWPKTYKRLRSHANDLNALDAAVRATCMILEPGLARHIRMHDNRAQARIWPMPHLHPATHHQKVAVFDRELLYIGGLDLDDRRFDTPEHDGPSQETWHDTQVMMRGPVAAQAHAHLGRFLDETAGRIAPAPAPGLLRTLSTRRPFAMPFIAPRTLVSELSQAHLDAVASARRLIYLETQFFRDRALARALARAAEAHPRLELVLIVPGAPEDVAFDGATGDDARYGEYLQAKCVKRLRKAFGPRIFVGSPAQPRRGGTGRGALYGAPLIYLHAKVSVFDDDLAIISSANLNGRSFRWDTELGVDIRTPAHVREIRETCFAHWLPDAAAPLPDAPVRALSDLARANSERLPETRRGFLLPYASRPARRFGRNLPGIPEDIV